MCVLRFYRCGLAFLAAAAITAPVATAQAQSFELEPITLDISSEDTSDTEEFVLVDAYSPDNSAPLLGKTGSLDRSAVRATQGRPLPSVILGYVPPGEEITFGIETLLQDTITSHVFRYDDREAREALRSSNPELFRQLVSEGHIDPPADQLVTALQTELARMNCYRSSIDGVWGGGSRRSVAGYFEALDNGQSWNERNPSNKLFQSILINGDATCEVTAAARPVSTSSRRQNSAPTPRAAQPAARPAAPAPANSNSIGTIRGVFR